MRVLFKSDTIILTPEDETESAALAELALSHEDHVFHLVANDGKGAALHDLGLRDNACRTPINISYDGALEWRPISNLALTPFEFDGRFYASIEGFWQGLKYDEPSERDRIASLHGGEAKQAGNGTGARAHITYRDAQIAVGSPKHWSLMKKACHAKFTTNDEARTALLATGQRPLMHRVRRDSRTIPGVIMADIWMQIRAGLSGMDAETIEV